MEKNLTTGSVLKSILYFSLPYLLAYFLQTLYGMADLFIIGQFEGISNITAVSIGSQVMHMLTVMIVGLAMGATVNIGQAIGAGNKKQAAQGIGNTVILFMMLAIVGSAVLLFFIRPIVEVMSTPQEAVSETVIYLTICFLGIPFITAYNIISSIFRGMGDSKSPMYFVAAACIVNIILDYIFIGGLHMGAAGAALGTTCSQTISVIIAFVVIMKKKTGIALSKHDFKIDRKTMSRLLKIGVPVALQDGFIQVAFIIITVIANRRGLDTAAAVGIVEKIISFLFLVPSSMLSTVSALGAQNIGADKPERAQRILCYAVMITVAFGIIISVIIQMIAGPVVGLFTENTRVILLGSQYIRGYIFDCIFAGVHFSFSGYFCACGHSELSFIHNIIAIILVRIPGVYITSKVFSSLFPMGLATVGGSILSVIICIAAYIWIKKKQSCMN